MKKLVFLLLLLTLLKGIISSIIVPLWEFPDEQAHFAHVAYLVESGSAYQALDLSKEIYEAEKIMGTVRDVRGINNYTYNPGFKPAYAANSTSGIYETYLNNFPEEWRTTYVTKEAALYPKLFYWGSGLGYSLAYDQNLVIRVFFTRLVSIVLMCVSVYVSFLIGQEIFKKPIYSLMLATMVSFHPMFSFVGSGVNNDNGVNLIGFLIIWLSYQILHRHLTVQRSLFLGILFGLGIFTKPLVVPVIMASGLVLIYEWYQTKRSWKKQLVLMMPLILGSITTGGWLILKPFLLSGKIPYLTYQKEFGMADLTFWQYLKPQIGRYYRETLVWYWGVFKWLGVILPLNLIRLLKVLMIIASIGLIKEIFKPSILKRKADVWIGILFTLVFIVALTWWDYDGVRKNGFSHGLQGRYFFSVLVAHMFLLLVGWLALVPEAYRRLVAKCSGLGFISMHMVSWWVLMQAYYQTDSVRILFQQMSQYKPAFLKYPYALIWIGLYAAIIILYIVTFIRYNQPYSTNKQKLK